MQIQPYNWMYNWTFNSGLYNLSDERVIAKASDQDCNFFFCYKNIHEHVNILNKTLTSLI